jgi:hypothetical protein
MNDALITQMEQWLAGQIALCTPSSFPTRTTWLRQIEDPV